MITSPPLHSNIRHVAIIMDGNGRWARSRGHARVWGHIRGSRIVSGIVEEATLLGIEALTLYAFSSENWARPKKEILTLFQLLSKFLKKERERMLKNKICFRVIGSLKGLPDATIELIEKMQEESKFFSGLKLTFCIGYGGRDEIIQAVNKFIESHPSEKITSDLLEKNLMTFDLGDVDLMIRTGGDQRLSNFLLWQNAYAELCFIEKPWPDFTRYDLSAVVKKVSMRERRFGGLNANENLSSTIKKASENLDAMSKQTGNNHD